MNRTTLASAIAAVLASGGAMAQPSISQINAVPAANTIYIAGSSAIKTALINNILNNFCNSPSTATQITSNGTNKNFQGISCNPGAGNAANTNLYNVWIRVEGGSVSGYLPIANNIGIKQIDGATLTANPITINGASTGNGTNDSFTATGGSLVAHKVDLGIGDVEPKSLINSNYPTSYATSVWGPVNNSGMFRLAAGQLVDEVYAIFVNENSTVFKENPLALSQQTVAAILSHQFKNWSQVTDVNGATVVSAPLAITIFDRESGSGSRAATDILMVGDGCSSAGKSTVLFDANPTTDYFSTGDVMTAANGTAGAVTYATIDNQFLASPVTGAGSTSFPNMTMVSLNGVVPSNLAAASGTYPFWVEASYVDNSAVTGADDVAIKNIVAGLQAQGTTSSLADINVIPDVTLATGGTANTTVHANAVNSGAIPSGGLVTVYINPYTRNDTTCSTPTSDITVFD
jgi:hypothetical protein